MKAVVACILMVDKDETVKVAKVLPSCVERYVVLTKLAKFAVEIWPAKLAVETWFARFAVLIIEPNTTVER